jgi:hypothetical protein
MWMLVLLNILDQSMSDGFHLRSALSKLDSIHHSRDYQDYEAQKRQFQEKMIRLAHDKEMPIEMPLPAMQRIGKLYTPYGKKHIGFLGLAEHPTMDAIYLLLDNIEFTASAKAFSADGHYNWKHHRPVAVALLKLGNPAMTALVNRLSVRDYDESYHGAGVHILVEYYGKDLAIHVLNKAGEKSESARKCAQLLSITK